MVRNAQEGIASTALATKLTVVHSKHHLLSQHHNPIHPLSIRSDVQNAIQSALLLRDLETKDPPFAQYEPAECRCEVSVRSGGPPLKAIISSYSLRLLIPPYLTHIFHPAHYLEH